MSTQPPKNLHIVPRIAPDTDGVGGYAVRAHKHYLTRSIERCADRYAAVIKSVIQSTVTDASSTVQPPTLGQY